ncbi:putative RNA-directed DNA polymerase from transposon BS [Frankliniella fusca]|uniref:RNA-directed DNA polymerase from transposon BS n=1 Tax=Frankliniella fusca TaxID=407009 RepID=A0AAE1H622_9NEOP|nr:putative RNA-directed DNA polymerase from transposon BS [Frankliniella fusca]
MTIIKENIHNTFLLIYNPPNNSTETFISELALLLENLPRNSYIFGDFNTDVLKENTANLQLTSLMSSFGFTLCNSAPTRLGSTCETLIDHIYTNNMASNMKIENIQNDLSDHNFLLASISNPKSTTKEAPPRLLKSINTNKLNIYLTEKPFQPNEHYDAESLYQSFVDYVNVGIEESTTEKISRSTEALDDYAPWIDKEYLEMKRSHSLEKEEKNEYYSKILEDPKDLDKNIWKVANRVLYNKSEPRNHEFKLSNDGVPVNEENIPDTFVNYFTSAVDKLLEKDIAHQCSEEETSKYIEKIPKINSTFRLHPTTAQEVSKYIDQLKNKSNATLDNITNKLLKKIKTNISPLISRIINKSFQDGIVPSQMKISRVNGRKSSTSPIRHGVIQGSTLGPLLFIIFINDISTLKLHGNPTLFADDTNVFYFGNSTAEIKNQMEEDFITIKKWLRLNLLFINVEKTNYIIFSKPGASQEENDHLTLDNQEVKKSETVKFLGLTLDHHLHWNDHIDSVTRKLAPIIGALHRIRNILSEKAKKSIYYGLIQSQLSYMNLIWGSATETRLHPLKTMQNRAIKTLFEKEYRTPTTQLYKPLGFLPLAKLHEKTLMTTGFAIYNEFWRCQTIFARNFSVHSHNTRSCNLLHTQSFKSSKYGIRSIYNSIVQAFNSIPQEYSNCNNMKSFKTAINKFILSTL